MPTHLNVTKRFVDLTWVAIDPFPESIPDLQEVTQLTSADLIEFLKSDLVSKGKALISATILSSHVKNNETFLYDATIKAVDDTALMVNFRKAVIVLSDGFDFGSTNTLNQVISNATAKGVPILTVGIGTINAAVLAQMANDTGGQFFVAQTSQNLATIYQQLSSVLYEKQYILKFNQQAAYLVEQRPT